MKTKKNFYAILALLLWMGSLSLGYAQSLIRQDGKVFLEQNDEQWEIDTTKIIVRINTAVAYPADLKVNKLGITTVPVPQDVCIESFLDSLCRQPYVRLAEYNVKGRQAPFDDLLFSSQWYYTGYDIDLLVTTVPMMPQKHIIAIIDTGLDFNHPDLGINISNGEYGALYVNDGEIPDNNIDDDDDGYVDNYIGWDFYHNRNYFDEVNIHGTQVFGLIGAKTNNYIGISGYSGNRNDIKLMPLCAGTGFMNADAVADAIRYAVDHGAHIINMSFTLDGNGNNNVDSAIAYARSKGVLMVAAAGNDSSGTGYPAFDWRVMGVSSVNANNTLSSFSNCSFLDVAAPGDSCYVLDRMNGNYIYSKLPGTSFSAPMVSVLAAYIMAKNPFIKADDVRCIIDSTAVNNPIYTTYNHSCHWDNLDSNETKPYSSQLGFGRIQPLAAIAAAGSKLPYVHVYDWRNYSNYIEFDFDIGNLYSEIQYEPYIDEFPDAKYALSWQVYVPGNISPSSYYLDDGGDWFVFHIDKSQNQSLPSYIGFAGTIKDLDGNIVYAFYNMVSLQSLLSSQSSQSSFTLSKGLVSDEIIIRKEGEGHLERTDAVAMVYSLGNQVMRQQSVSLDQPTISVNVSSLPKGHYIVKLTSGSKNVFSGHVIKTR